MSIKYSRHADVRANQRGFRFTDIDLIRCWGTPIDDPEADVYLLRNQDVDSVVVDLKRQIQRLGKLRGCKAVFAGDTLITVHRATRQHEKSLLRKVY